MKLGVSFKIDVKKLDKLRFFMAQSGAAYADLTAFIDTEEQDQYGQNGGITQSATKEEREQGVKMPFIGNCKVFYKADNTGNQARQSHQQAAPQPAPAQPPGQDQFDPNIPF